MIKLEFDPPRAQLSQFGWISLIGFPLVGAMIAWNFGVSWTLFWVLLGLGVVTFIASRIDPKLVRPLFVGLMLIAVPIGLVISFVLMALIYYGLFLPVGLVFRLFGRDPLAKRPDPEMKSYWHVRGAPRPGADYLRLY